MEDHNPPPPQLSRTLTLAHPSQPRAAPQTRHKDVEAAVAPYLASPGPATIAAVLDQLFGLVNSWSPEDAALLQFGGTSAGT